MNIKPQQHHQSGQSSYQYPSSVIPDNPILQMLPSFSISSLWHLLLIDDRSIGLHILSNDMFATFVKLTPPNMHIPDGALPYVLRKWWLSLVDGCAPLHMFNDIHRGIVHALSCEETTTIKSKTNGLTQRLRCLSLPNVPLLNESLNGDDKNVKEIFLTQRLTMVTTFLTNCMDLISNTNDINVRTNLITIIGWILHDGIRSIWKQLYELSNGQMYITWSKTYDADGMEMEETDQEMDQEMDHEMDHEMDSNQWLQPKDEIIIVVKYWCLIVKNILTKITIPEILLGGGTNGKATKHQHCNIIKPLMTGIFGFNGSANQQNEAKNGEMYIDSSVVEPNRTNEMLQIYVGRFIDLEIAGLKTVVKEWIEGLKEGGSDELKSYMGKLV